jgi:hypothetical protein
MRLAFPKLRISRALVLGTLCIALVMLSGMIQAAHFHPADQPDHDCALCLAAHSMAYVAPPVVLHVSVRPVAASVTPQTIFRPRPALHFRLASRPPPAPSAFVA